MLFDDDNDDLLDLGDDEVDDDEMEDLSDEDENL